MPDMLIRDIDPKTLKKLKDRAKRNGNSLQSEAKQILEQSAGADDLHALMGKWKSRFKGRKFSSSVDLLREDRNR